MTDERREIDPYVMVNNGRDWYVVGMCLRSRETRTFSLAGIHKPEIMEQRFSLPKEFSIKEYLHEGFSRMHGEKSEAV